MSFTLPNLDDRTYADLVAEGLRVVTAVDDEWTNRNASDPGITLLELFAFVTETLIFRVNQISDEDLRAFARLLWPDVGGSPQLAARDQLREAVRRARRLERIVTCEDFEQEALADPEVARAHCVPQRDLTVLTRAARAAKRPGHVSVLIVPQPDAQRRVDQVIERVTAYLEPRCLVATTVHVGEPEYVRVGVRLTVALVAGASPDAVRGQIVSALTRFFDPRVGGPDGNGWPVGRRVHVSELYQLVDRIPGVDYATRSFDPAKGAPAEELVTESRDRFVRNDAGEVASLTLHEHELLTADIDPQLIQVRRSDEERERGQKS